MTQEIIAKYPSNIALVKYWGKHGNQLPCNASLSMTLTHAFTEVKLQCTPKNNAAIELAYFFEGKPKDSFKERIIKYASQQKEFATLLQQYAITIHSTNSFPHSTGIASSASAFAAIAAALLKATNTFTDTNFKNQASSLARLGSGSACRSFFGPFALWGNLENVENATNEFAIPINTVHENFSSMKDAILIVEDTPKKVSSSVGHALMNNHPYANARFLDANNNCKTMLSVLKNGDFETFIAITEREALTLHAMMMTSQDYYMLMKPETVFIIEQIFNFREETKLPVCFTLDAGPNIHLLYPASIEKNVNELIEQRLKNKLKSVLYDQAGLGGVVN
jgi:diphosphomevalonate decarboxylase